MAEFVAGPDPLAPPDPPRWWAEIDYEDMELAAARPGTAPELLRAIHQTYSAVFPALAERLAGNPATPPDVIFELAAVDENGLDVAEHARIARRNGSAPAELRAWLVAGDPVSLTANPSATPDELDAVLDAAYDGDVAVWTAATHPNLSVETAERLAAHPLDVVRWHLAANTALPGALLDKLSSDDAAPVRAAAAANPSLPPARAAELALGHQPEKVVAAAVSNPGTTPDVLAQVVADTWSAKARRAAAAHPACPPAVLALLAEDPRVTVQLETARHPHTPPGALARLAGSDRGKVRRAVARHTSTPPETLAVLAADPDPKVRGDAAANKRTPAHGKAAAGLLAD